MDVLAIILIALVVLALGGWGYGSYGPRPLVVGEDVPAGPAPWVNPLGLIGLFLLVALLVLLFTGWRPVW